ncbi:MAG: peptidoglycan DD-metalloendopeptidase family protein [Schaalia hyovaginalis]|uniref:M23 family metallopeptidase n=1 Tax=Schaalia hyovaginalis TaxID=29316 RepID=UPI0023F78F29|nr:M23 family metallopeptidase [Schaalia hyovaginalis]MCI7672151.1 peptidoglycan DD-metalloendopeptidase family protein [Schaalia hyovaginalis]MDY5507007.1 peptidoglycan DD-metalloendopeptidase family protein [Schaalia hyovaginalis]
MNVPLHPHSRLLRGRALAAGAVVALTALVTTVTPSAADDRDDVERQRDAASNQVDQLSADLEGIDSELAAIYLDLQTANERIPEAEKQLEDARKRRDTANREHEVAIGQLNAAQAEKDRLVESSQAAQAKEELANEAIGQLARQMYRNGSDSPAVVAFTKSGTENIGQRAAAADAMARSQSQAIAAAIDVRTRQRTQESRQTSITDRISALEKTAADALAAAQKAENDAQAGLAALEKAKSDAETKQAAWDARKSEAADQLRKAQDDYKALNDRLAAIDAAAAAQGAVPQSSASGLTFPLRIPMVMTSPYGMRLHPVIGIWRLHDGTDFAASCGTPLYSSAPGYVSDASWDEGGGNTISINHGTIGGAQLSTTYLHLQAPASVSVGQYVDTNTVIGYVGTTGYSTGCHLHLTVRVNGGTVDPMGYL